MAFDAHANLAITAVATAPSPATSGTSLVVTAAAGSLFPTVPFNATVWAVGQTPTSTNAEIIRVTARSTDTLTIVRAQEGTTARTIVAGDQIMAGITKKTITDIEGATGFYQTVQVIGSAQTQRPILDLAAGQSLTIAGADDAGNSRTIVTLSVTNIDGGASA